MKYIVTTSKTVDEVCNALETIVPAHKFGIIATHNLKATMAKKGVEFEPEVRIFEICNPMKAKAVLTEDMSLNMALPCRISVYQQDGETHIGMIKPAAMLKQLNDSPALAAVAEEVEKISMAIINEAK